MLKHFVFGIAAFFIISMDTYAATVSSTTSVTAEFDVTGLTPATITRYGYSCRKTCGPSGSGDPNNLQKGAHIRFKIGSHEGSDDIASLLFPTPAQEDIPNLTTSFGLSDVEPVSASITSIFITLEFVDDQFDVDTVMLFIGGHYLYVPAH